MTLPKTKEQIAQETAQSEQERLQNFSKELARKGINPDVIKQVIEGGFTNFSGENMLAGMEDSP